MIVGMTTSDDYNTVPHLVTGEPVPGAHAPAGPGTAPIGPGSAPLVAGEPVTPTADDPVKFEQAFTAPLPGEDAEAADIQADGKSSEAEDQLRYAAKCEEWLAAEKAAWIAWLDAEIAEWRHPEDWPHDWVEFKGDRLGIKIPTSGMTNALLHAGTTSEQFQIKLVQMFERTCFSDATKERVLSRMAAEYDPEYGTGSEFDELSQMVTRLGAERDLKAAENLNTVK